MSELSNSQKRYIEENYSKKSYKEIALNLRVKKNLVCKYIKKLKKQNLILKNSNSLSAQKAKLKRAPNSLITALSLTAVLVINIVINSNTFYMHHITGDQRTYLGAAMKLDKAGFKGYNLRRINIAASGQFIKYYYSEKEEKGDLLTMLEREGTLFYTTPVFVSPPLFPYLITFSHRLFARDKPYLAVLRDKDPRPWPVRSKDKFLAQFYCTFVPLLFGLFLVLVSFFIGKFLFSDLVGIFSALLVSISPIYILASQRIWADTTLSLFIALSALLCYLAASKDSLKFLILSGISFGLGLLTKNSAALILFTIIGCFYIYGRQARGLLRTNLNIVLFVVIGILVAFPWYIVATKAFGTPLHTPFQEGIWDKMDWFKFLNTRPWYTFLVDIPFQVPLYIFGYLAVLLTVFRKNRLNHHLFLGLWFVSFLIFLTHGTHTNKMLGPDNRYMLPAYPALAVLSASLIDKLRGFLSKKLGFALASIFTGVLFTGCSIWSLRLIFKIVHFADVIVAPF